MEIKGPSLKDSSKSLKAAVVECQSKLEVLAIMRPEQSMGHSHRLIPALARAGVRPSYIPGIRDGPFSATLTSLAVGLAKGQ